MWIRPATMQATAMRAGALASRSRVVLGTNIAAHRLVLAARPMATAAAKKSTIDAEAPKKKTAAKPKAKTVKKEAVKKTAEAPMPVSPKRKADAEKKLLIDEKKRLVELGLFTEPPREPTVVFRLFMKQWFVKTPKPGVSPLLQVYADYKKLSPAEYEELEEAVAKNRIANEVAYKAWVHSHTPAQINEANKARSRLARVFKIKHVKGIRASVPIKDDRIPTPPLSGYLTFVQSKLKQVAAVETISYSSASGHMISVAAEWKNLSDSERKVYQDLASAEKVKYEKLKEELDLK
ncbi:hypothetical protein PspLS_07605 [Pyricularia sp. CBS 133598]|nr:hypothetical protein PspLS_07605 [Pyricularia sp. CBS 133598]